MPPSKKNTAFKGDGIIIFQDVSQAIQAEKAVKGAGYETRLIAPPPEFHMGCEFTRPTPATKVSQI